MATITSTFYLKNASANKESLIMFQCNFKHEEKRFYYSTGERILPKHWDFINRRPIKRGTNRSLSANSIDIQLNRYIETFEKIQTRCKLYGEEFTSQLLRDGFDREFKKVPKGSNLFHKAFRIFMDEHERRSKWAPNTIKRYKNLQNILEDLEECYKIRLTFNSVNNRFLTRFTDYSLNVRKHSTNTFRRNLGLFKTFMLWSLDNGYTYNDEFKRFKRPKPVISRKVALNERDLHNLLLLDLKNKRLEKTRDVFLLACTTGLRFGELKLLGEHNVSDSLILLKEEKSNNKVSRKIPLNNISRMILEKYDYKLPLMSNQKHNQFIKDLFKEAGYTGLVEKTTVKGSITEREKVPFYSLITSHTARRTFITMMKRKGKSDKLIAKITGHTDLNTLNQYYQVEYSDTFMAVSDVFDGIKLPLRIAN